MQVGYYRDPSDNPRTRKINAIAYHYYGMELVCFNSNDVDIENSKITGKVFSNGKWINKTTDVPIVINNTPYKKNKEVYNFLNDNSYLMFSRYKDKESTNEALLEDGEYSHLLIPTIGLNEYNDINSFLREYKNIILKPKNGSQGKGIYSLSFYQDEYLLSYGNDTDTLSEAELKDFIETRLMNRNYIIQKQINSRNNFGQPFDVRLQFEKNRNGKWVIAQSYVRIGGGQKVVSNVSKGGSVVRLKSFLKANYDEEWKDYFTKVKEITKGLPEKIETLNDADIVSLAFDFGLENQNYYLYEVNYFPGGTYARGEVAMLRAAYTKYLLKSKFNKDVYYSKF